MKIIFKNIKIILKKVFFIKINVLYLHHNLKIKKSKIMNATKKVYLTNEYFQKDLQECLTIIAEPTETNLFYVCEYVSPALYKSIVNVYITN
jgi:hypothetical protein